MRSDELLRSTQNMQLLLFFEEPEKIRIDELRRSTQNMQLLPAVALLHVLVDDLSCRLLIYLVSCTITRRLTMNQNNATHIHDDDNLDAFLPRAFHLCLTPARLEPQRSKVNLASFLLHERNENLSPLAPRKEGKQHAPPKGSYQVTYMSGVVVYTKYKYYI